MSKKTWADLAAEIAAGAIEAEKKIAKLSEIVDNLAQFGRFPTTEYRKLADGNIYTELDYVYQGERIVWLDRDSVEKATAGRGLGGFAGDLLPECSTGETPYGSEGEECVFWELEIVGGER